MAVFGGLLGAFFVSVNNVMGKLRKAYIGTSKVKKVIETLIFTAVTCTVCYFAPSWINDCLNEDNSGFPSPDDYVQYQCPDGQYNQLGTLFFNAQSDQFSAFLTNDFYLNYQTLLIYFICWYCFGIVTLGISVPMGLFVSGILMGCSFGRLWALFLQEYVLPGLHPGSYALVGATAILSGYARHTFSLTVIMLECSN